MKTSKRAQRRSQRERLIRRATKNHDNKLYSRVWGENDRFRFYVDRLGYSEKEARKRLAQERIRAEREIRQDVACPSKYAYHDRGYTEAKLIVASRDAQRDLKEQLADIPRPENVRTAATSQRDIV